MGWFGSNPVDSGSDLRIFLLLVLGFFGSDFAFSGLNSDFFFFGADLPPIQFFGVNSTFLGGLKIHFFGARTPFPGADFPSLGRIFPPTSDFGWIWVDFGWIWVDFERI